MQRASSVILESQNEGTGFDNSEEFINNEQNRKHILRKSESPHQKRGKFETTVEQVQALLKKYYPISPDTIKDKIPSNNPDFLLSLHNPTNDKNYLTACKLFNLEINTYSFDYFERLCYKRTPIFYANELYPFNYYYDLDTSVEFLNKLLLYQNEDSDECVGEFLQNLKWWFDKQG